MPIDKLSLQLETMKWRDKFMKVTAIFTRDTPWAVIEIEKLSHSSEEHTTSVFKIKWLAMQVEWGLLCFLLARTIYSSAVKIEPVLSSTTSVNLHRAKRVNIPEHSSSLHD
jgi:hypothetical protein